MSASCTRSTQFYSSVSFVLTIIVMHKPQLIAIRLAPCAHPHPRLVSAMRTSSPLWSHARYPCLGHLFFSLYSSLPQSAAATLPLFATLLPLFPIVLPVTFPRRPSRPVFTTIIFCSFLLTRASQLCAFSVSMQRSSPLSAVVSPNFP